MKGLIPRVLDHMYFLMDQSEKEVCDLLFNPTVPALARRLR